MTYEIEVSDSQSCLAVDVPWIQARLQHVLRMQQVSAAQLSVAIVDDETMHRINQTHLQHDYPTDVLSFLYSETRPGTADSTGPRGAGKLLEGELVVSAQTALRESREFGWQAHDELTLYLVHGLLHLCGYDDLTDQEQSEMRAQEQAVLKSWGLIPHYVEREPACAETSTD